jgi:hypothetical protein
MATRKTTGQTTSKTSGAERQAKPDSSANSSAAAGSKQGSEEVVEVTIDMTETEVLALNEKGVKLNFSVEEFLELSEDAVKALYRENLMNYSGAKALYARHKRYEEQPDVLKRVKAKSKPLRTLGNTATRKLRAKEFVKPGMHPCWKRPDEVDEALEQGYTFVPDGEGGTKARRTKVGEADDGSEEFAGFRQVKDRGKVEQVLMQIPEERYQEHLKAMSVLSKGNYHMEKDRIREVANRLEKDHQLSERLITRDTGENEPG